MKKIIITGAARTGTTVISNLLTMSPKIIVTPELGLFDCRTEYYNQRKNELPVTNEKQYSRLCTALKHKGLTIDDMEKFLVGNYEKRDRLEFYGDKWPTYCVNKEVISHLVKNHSDAYYIFTYRNPCATVFSRLHRSRAENLTSEEEKDRARDWYVKSIADTTQRLITHTTNWVDNILPHVKNKIIINYEDAVNDFDTLVSSLENFLNTSLDLPARSEMIDFASLEVDASYKKGRGIYENATVDKYKEELTQDEIDYITTETRAIDSRVRSLMKSL